MDRLMALVLVAYDQVIDLELGDRAVDGGITKAPCGGERAGRSSVDRGKQGLKRPKAHGIPFGAIVAPAKRHDSRLLAPTLATLDALGALPDAMTVSLDRGYDSGVTRERLEYRGLCGEIAERGKRPR